MERSLREWKENKKRFSLENERRIHRFSFYSPKVTNGEWKENLLLRWDIFSELFSRVWKLSGSLFLNEFCLHFQELQERSRMLSLPTCQKICLPTKYQTWLSCKVKFFTGRFRDPTCKSRFMWAGVTLVRSGKVWSALSDFSRIKLTIYFFWLRIVDFDEIIWYLFY